jgi:AcrR family transcriptional regulator
MARLAARAAAEPRKAGSRPPVARRGRGRPGGNEAEFDSREALLRAAHELLLETPGLPVTLAAICARAGVDAAMVRYHFESRRGLMTSIFERLCAAWAHELESLLALELSPRRKLEIHVRQIVRNYRRYPYTNRLMTELIASSRPALARRLSRNFVHPLVDFHRRLIAQGVAADEFRPVDPTSFFCSVIGLCEFQYAAQPLLRVAFGAPADETAEEEAFVRHTTRLLLDGLSVGRPSRRRRADAGG